jgi:hypothetical protein
MTLSIVCTGSSWPAATAQAGNSKCAWTTWNSSTMAPAASTTDTPLHSTSVTSAPSLYYSESQPCSQSYLPQRLQLLLTCIPLPPCSRHHPHSRPGPHPCSRLSHHVGRSHQQHPCSRCTSTAAEPVSRQTHTGCAAYTVVHTVPQRSDQCHNSTAS